MAKTTYIALLCSTVLAFGGSGAMAQNVPAQPEAADAQPSRGLEEIVVTARRRTESLQSVPVAVSAISTVQLQNNLATDLTKVAELAPQVMIGRQTIGTGAIIGIRGISSTSSDPGLDQSVAVALDGIILSRGRIVSNAVFDLAQVEVLAGPQAVFFGKNSPAGVISMKSADPTNRFEGYVRGGYEFNAKERYVEGAVSGPLSDVVRARFATRLAKMDGWMRNAAQPIADFLHPGVTVPGAVNGRSGPAGHDYAGRLTLVVDPGDDFTGTLKVLATEQTSNAMDAYTETFCTNGQTVPTVLGRVDPYADCSKNQVKSGGGLAAPYSANYPYGNGVPNYKSNGLLASLNLNKKFGDVTLTSTTGYYDQKHHGSNNADYTSYALIYSAQFEKYKLFTQEVRLNSDFEGSFNFAGGAYYESSKRDFGNFPDILHGGLNVAANNYTTVETYANAKTTTYSVFGQARWAFTDTLELAAGARYSNDRKDQDAFNGTVGVSATSFRPAGSHLLSKFQGDNVSPEVTLSWKPAPKQLVYAAYKTGYKAGAISNGALLTTAATSTNLVIGKEKAKGFEAGYKGDLLDNTLRFNIVGYRYKFSGLQLGTFNPTTISFTIQNAAAARTTGVEASLNWLATDQLTFNGNVGYNRARYISFNNAQCWAGQTVAQGCVAARQDLSGAKLNRAPDLTFNIGANYKVPMGSWLADFGADGSYSSSYQTAADNNPGGIQKSFWRLNAALKVGPEDKSYTFSLVGRNLTNSYYLISTSSRPLGTINEFVGIFNRPREVALQAEVRF